MTTRCPWAATCCPATAHRVSWPRRCRTRAARPCNGCRSSKAGSPTASPGSASTTWRAADGLAVDPDTHRCPDNGAGVDVDTCAISADAGAAQLAATWQDPDFQPDQEAFYYLRVLENPTCRWSTWDAVRHGTAPRDDLPATIQERAWSSPVWYHGSIVP
ncbi:MAG: DUF3604 domain-containing protein [Gammaproteobacteria bacterium]|nr:DUF3604 domain-containing protein [Gammaproteobacteria bacterium]